MRCNTLQGIRDSVILGVDGDKTKGILSTPPSLGGGGDSQIKQICILIYSQLNNENN